MNDAATVKAMSTAVAHYVCVDVFKKALLELTIEELTPQLLEPARMLSSCQPFPWSRPVWEGKKCVFNLVPCDNDFEREFAKFLDHAEHVMAFAKLPQAFGFAIEYIDAGKNLKSYYPDFVSVDYQGAHCLLETKGQETAEVARKDAAASQWCENATKLTGTSWNYLKVPQKEFEALQVSFRSLNAEKDACEADGNQLRQKLALLSKTHAESNGHVDCPLCGTDLKTEALERVHRSFESDIEARRAEYTRKRKEIDAIKREIVAVETAIEKERKQLEPLPKYQEDKAKYAQILVQLDEDEEKLEEAQSLLVAVKARLSEGDYAHEALKKLAAVEAEVGKLAYNKQEHAAARRRLRELEAERYAELYHSLESAGSELATVRASMSTDRKSLDAWTRDQQSDLEEIAALQPQVEQLEGEDPRK